MEDNQYQRHARKILIAIVSVAALGALLYWYVLPVLLLQKPADLFNSAEQLITKEAAKEVSLPPPLHSSTTAPKAKPPATTLTRAGIIANTNAQRKTNGGLPPLAENTTLNAVAAARAADMFQKQYFAHVAPDGGSAETIAKTLDYNYLALGENIAEGMFSGDADLVGAWMDSPGHRANILDTHYTQIGVAASQGVFEGNNVWIAVQIFGKPVGACPAINADLKAAIDSAKQQLSQMEAQISAAKAEINAMEPKHGDTYNQKVDEYNALVRQYNTLLEQTRLQVNKYNAQVTAFNLCVQGG